MKRRTAKGTKEDTKLHEGVAFSMAELRVSHPKDGCAVKNNRPNR